MSVAEPPSLPRVLVFGHSHIVALVNAHKAEAAAGEARFDLVSYQFLRDDRQHITNVDGKWRYHPDYALFYGRFKKMVLVHMLPPRCGVIPYMSPSGGGRRMRTSLAWVTQRLLMGVWTHVSNLLCSSKSERGEC